MQAVTLMHMIQNSKKPLLAIGFGAFLSIYALSTQGGKFHMLNGSRFLLYCIYLLWL